MNFYVDFRNMKNDDENDGWEEERGYEEDYDDGWEEEREINRDYEDEV